VTFKISMSKPDKFPLVLRVPTWCIKPALMLNGKPLSYRGKGSYIVIDRTWKSGDVLRFELPMRVEKQVWAAQKGAVSVNRGPITYSLKIDEKYVPFGSGAWGGYEVLPQSAWNFGLAPDTTFKVSKAAMSNQPFTPDSAPVQIQVKGRLVPEWQLDYLGLVAPLQQSPARTTQPIENLTLIPMGAARLRVSVFPTVSASGTEWKPPKKANPIIPAKASHVSFFDSTDALSDGFLPENSNDGEVPRFTFWDHKGTTEWVQYDFAEAKTFSQVQVYWFDDTGSGQCRVPESWRVLYLEGGEWKEAKARGPFGVEKDKMNTTDLEAFTAKSVRLEVKLKANVSAGILEWIMR
jgi:hypothetical protein